MKPKKTFKVSQQGGGAGTTDTRNEESQDQDQDQGESTPRPRENFFNKTKQSLLTGTAVLSIAIILSLYCFAILFGFGQGFEALPNLFTSKYGEVATLIVLALYLIGYLSGTENWQEPLRKVIIWEVVALVTILVFSGSPFLEKPGKTVVQKNEVVSPREVAGIPVIVTLEPKRVIRIYEGDVFKYKSPHGFWVKGESGPPYFHNPCNKTCKKREFEFYNVKKGGQNVSIYRDKNTSPEDFELRFWIEQG